MSQLPVPPGWPEHVRSPGTPGHVRTALNWLLEHCPSEYRSYTVLRHHPQAVAWLAIRHVQAQMAANTAARGAARAELHPVLNDVRAVQGVLDVLDHEQARLLGVHRAVHLIAAALAAHDR